MISKDVIRELLVTFFTLRFDDSVVESRLEDVYPRLFKIFAEQPKFEEVFNLALDELVGKKNDKTIPLKIIETVVDAKIARLGL